MSNLFSKCLNCIFSIPGDCTHSKKNERGFWDRKICSYFENKEKTADYFALKVNCFTCVYNIPGDCKHPENTPSNFLKFWNKKGFKECSYYKKKNNF